MLLREPGRASTSGETATAAAACVEPDATATRVALTLPRLATRRRRDWERARARVRARAVSKSDSVSLDAGEGESSSTSRSSSVHVWWPAAAMRESGLLCDGVIGYAVRESADAAGDMAEADGRELRSLSLPLESESSSVPSPTWRKLGEIELSPGPEGLEVEGHCSDDRVRERLARSDALGARRGTIDGERAGVVDGVLSTD